ncbi:DL-glycerol-3-phosphatase [Fusarium oxysporum]|nr:DL-glycerol-3-phosphatase [Fusarium oxysporum]KAJ4036073.1 DL-glycerol-3-phosphatase [Fusarium oxysporum]KAJ4075908.1 DL-glycerol-3-phosphatase [Fusarium oxysporum]KAJ4217834.1 DL-glycerol-3-phosphatase [Fusarium oxysporum]
MSDTESPIQKHSLSGFLIDLNGTIIDSTTAEIGVDPEVILETSHGRRSVDVLELLAPAYANWGFVKRIEAAIPVNHSHPATAESVKVGKPDPTCYFLGHKSLGSDGHDGKTMLVIGDSPAGIKADKDAGSKVLGLVTSHTYEQVKSAGPDWIVKDLESVKILGKNGDKVLVEIRKYNLTRLLDRYICSGLPRHVKSQYLIG